MANTTANPAFTAAFDDLITRLSALRDNSTGSARQVAIGRALTLLISRIGEAFSDEPVADAPPVPSMTFDQAQFAIWEASTALSAIAQLSNDAGEGRSRGLSANPEEMCCLLSVVNSHLQRGLSAIEQLGLGARA